MLRALWIMAVVWVLGLVGIATFTDVTIPGLLIVPAAMPFVRRSPRALYVLLAVICVSAIGYVSVIEHEKPYDSVLGTIGAAAVVGLAWAFREHADRSETEATKLTDSLEREHAVSERLQRSLLPHDFPDHLDSIECAALYQPAVRGLDVGGDWYDTFPIDNGMIAFGLGDAVGKGLDAAVTMGKIRAAIRALATVDCRPELVSAALVRLCDQYGWWATVIYGTIDPSTRLLRFVNHGHWPMMLVTNDGETRVLGKGAQGLPLGAATTSSNVIELTAPPGAVLFLYTDGLVESRNQVPNLAQLSSATSQVATLDPTVAVKTLVDLLAEANDGSDDICILALRFNDTNN